MPIKRVTFVEAPKYIPILPRTDTVDPTVSMSGDYFDSITGECNEAMKKLNESIALFCLGIGGSGKFAVMTWAKYRIQLHQHPYLEDFPLGITRASKQVHVNDASGGVSI